VGDVYAMAAEVQSKVKLHVEQLEEVRTYCSGSRARGKACEVL
jgi:hypothetical protein